MLIIQNIIKRLGSKIEELQILATTNKENLKKIIIFEKGISTNRFSIIKRTIKELEKVKISLEKIPDLLIGEIKHEQLNSIITSIIATLNDITDFRIFREDLAILSSQKQIQRLQIVLAAAKNKDINKLVALAIEHPFNTEIILATSINDMLSGNSQDKIFLIPANFNLLNIDEKLYFAYRITSGLIHTNNDKIHTQIDSFKKQLASALSDRTPLTFDESTMIVQGIIRSELKDKISWEKLVELLDNFFKNINDKENFCKMSFLNRSTIISCIINSKRILQRYNIAMIQSFSDYIRRNKNVFNLIKENLKITDEEREICKNFIILLNNNLLSLEPREIIGFLNAAEVIMPDEVTELKQKHFPLIQTSQDAKPDMEKLKPASYHTMNDGELVKLIIDGLNDLAFLNELQSILEREQKNVRGNEEPRIFKAFNKAMDYIDKMKIKEDENNKETKIQKSDSAEKTSKDSKSEKEGYIRSLWEKPGGEPTVKTPVKIENAQEEDNQIKENSEISTLEM